MKIVSATATRRDGLAMMPPRTRLWASEMRFERFALDHASRRRINGSRDEGSKTQSKFCGWLFGTRSAPGSSRALE